MTRALFEIWPIWGGALVSSKFNEYVKKIGVEKIPVVGIVSPTSVNMSWRDVPCASGV